MVFDDFNLDKLYEKSTKPSKAADVAKDQEVNATENDAKDEAVSFGRPLESSSSAEGGDSTESKGDDGSQDFGFLGIGRSTNFSNSSSSWSSDSGTSTQDYVIESDLVVPKIETIQSEKPLIVVIDDDFETLDLLEIYLKRNYECVTFSGPREAIYFLNQRVPALILIDCKIHTINARMFAQIIRSGVGKENVPFVFTGNDEELYGIDLDEEPDYFIGKLKRPIARGELQAIIDMVIKPEDNQ